MQAEIKQGGRKMEKEDCAVAQKRCFDMKTRLSECWGHTRHCRNRLSAGDLKRAMEHSRLAKVLLPNAACKRSRLSNFYIYVQYLTQAIAQAILKLAKPSSQDDRADYEKVKAVCTPQKRTFGLGTACCPGAYKVVQVSVADRRRKPGDPYVV